MRLLPSIMLYCIAVVHIVVIQAHISLRDVASNEADKSDNENTGYHVEHNNSEPMLIMSQTTNGMTFSIHTKFLLVFMDIQTTVFLNYSIDCSTAEDNYNLYLDLSKEYVAKVTTLRPVYIKDVKRSCERFGSAEGLLNVTLSGILPGRTNLLIQVIPNTTEIFNSKSKDSGTMIEQPYMYSTEDGFVNNEQGWVVNINNTSNIPAKFLIVCLPKPSTLEKILRPFMMVYMVLIMTTMGCKTELKILKQVMKKPVAPAIGMFCQFILMPLIAFTITRLITFPSTGMALGFFACGCAPGGGGSNLWTYLLRGDVSLSVAMTTMSSMAAIGTFPLWIFTLGRVVLSDQLNLAIPYFNIIISVLMVSIPLLIGAFINYKKPVFTAKMLRFLIPFIVILTIVFIALSLYVNSYMFRLMKPILLLAGAMLPCIGYLSGLGLALLLKQSWCFCKTIAIETGIQNPSIAFIMVMFSFAPPDNVLAGTAPIAAASMTPIPLLVIATIYHIYLRCCATKFKAPSITVTVEKEGVAGNDKEKEVMVEKISSL